MSQAVRPCGGHHKPDSVRLLAQGTGGHPPCFPAGRGHIYLHFVLPRQGRDPSELLGSLIWAGALNPFSEKLIPQPVGGTLFR